MRWLTCFHISLTGLRLGGMWVVALPEGMTKPRPRPPPSDGPLPLMAAWAAKHPRSSSQGHSAAPEAELRPLFRGQGTPSLPRPGAGPGVGMGIGGRG